jgi:hypothetical protein
MGVIFIFRYTLAVSAVSWDLICHAVIEQCLLLWPELLKSSITTIVFVIFSLLKLHCFLPVTWIQKLC